MNKRIHKLAAIALGVSLLGLAAPAPAQALLNPGPDTQYPSAGGTWQYGFWNLKARSYYTNSRCHGSTVVVNSRTSRSINTASGAKSIAELTAVNIPGQDDTYYYRNC